VHTRHWGDTDIYTETPKDWDLSLPIQNEHAIVILILCTLMALR
jgi:hypothetical protein